MMNIGTMLRSRHVSIVIRRNKYSIPIAEHTKSTATGIKSIAKPVFIINVLISCLQSSQSLPCVHSSGGILQNTADIAGTNILCLQLLHPLIRCSSSGKNRLYPVYPNIPYSCFIVIISSSSPRYSPPCFPSSDLLCLLLPHTYNYVYYANEHSL